MIYLLDGKETYFLAKKKNSILSNPDLLKENITTLDGSSKSQLDMKEVLMLCNTTSLFSEQRAVIVDNPYFLKATPAGKGTKKKKNEKEDVFTLLEEYCKSPIDTTDLIFYCFGYDADKRTKGYNILKSYENKTVSIYHFSELSSYELDEKINKELTGSKYQLTKDALAEFKTRIGGSTTEYYRALEKLDLYGKKNLDYEDITHLVSANPEVDLWKLGNAFLARNELQMMRSYRELIEIERMPIPAIISVLASQLRNVYNCVACYEAYMNESEIKAYTGRFYPMKDIQSANGRSARDLLKILADLAELDQKIKRGEINDMDAFELFLLRSCL